MDTVQLKEITVGPHVVIRKVNEKNSTYEYYYKDECFLSVPQDEMSDKESDRLMKLNFRMIIR